MLVREGQAAATRSQTEQLLFRVPLSLASALSSSSSSSSGGEPTSTSTSTTPTSTPLAVFLHISDRDVARSVSLLSVAASQDASSLARIDGNLLTVDFTPTSTTPTPTTTNAAITASPTSAAAAAVGTPGGAVGGASAGVSAPAHTLVARCFPLPASLPPPLPSHLPNHHPSHPPSHPSASGHERGGASLSHHHHASLSSGDEDEGASHGALPGFRWKLVVLGHHPFEEPPPVHPPATPTPTPLHNPLQRYRGAYKDNNSLTIFRDVITVDKASFPLALRLSMAPLPVATPTSGGLLTAGEGVATGSPPGTIAPPPSSSSANQNNNDNNNDNDDNDNEHDHYNYHKSHPPVNVAEELMFVVRLYRKDDRQLVYETRARGVAQLYNLPLADFLPPPGTLPPARCRNPNPILQGK